MVEDTPIYARAIAAHARAMGADARHALDDLIGKELLAREARRAGLEHAPEVEQARAQALVRSFVVGDFGARTATPDTMPEADARPVYQRLDNYFDHERIARVLNVCTTPAIAKSIWDEARAHRPANGDAFRAIAARFGGQAQEVTPQDKAGGFQPPWRDAIFAAMRKAGDMLPPTEFPKFPYPCTTHIAYCIEMIPPRHDSFEAALPEVRQKSFDSWRRREFLAWVTDLARKHKIEVAPEVLERAEAAPDENNP
jgi:hypothetical protein